MPKLLSEIESLLYAIGNPKSQQTLEHFEVRRNERAAMPPAWLRISGDEQVVVPPARL
jgi:hypothetical protein